MNDDRSLSPARPRSYPYSEEADAKPHHVLETTDHRLCRGFCIQAGDLQPVEPISTVPFSFVHNAANPVVKSRVPNVSAKHCSDRGVRKIEEPGYRKTAALVPFTYGTGHVQSV